MARDCKIAQKCIVLDVEKWGTLLEIVSWHRDVSTMEVWHATRNCFQPKRVAAMSHEQRNDGKGLRKDFQQSSQNSNYRNETAGSDVNQTSVKTIHEDVMVCTAHNRESCHECNTTAKKCHAMLASELTLECGCKLPVIADACQVHNERMPVCIGMMGGQCFSVERYRMFDGSSKEGVSEQ